MLDKLAVRFGVELTRLVPGDVSAEVDAVLSFDQGAMIARARSLIALYEAQGVGRDRVLIKLAATWEGICCNLTLVFNLEQAWVGAFLISPVVGRITDWDKKAEGRDDYPVEALAGCDRLTISPAPLGEPDRDEGVLERALSPGGAPPASRQQPVTEPALRWALVGNQMAGEKLTGGIRLFHQDYLRLREDVQARLARVCAPQAVPTS